jgi:hypothetical protein
MNVTYYIYDNEVYIDDEITTDEISGMYIYVEADLTLDYETIEAHGHKTIPTKDVSINTAMLCYKDPLNSNPYQVLLNSETYPLIENILLNI